MPPCRQCGARVEPWRARPVPFCRHGFRLPPDTSLRVLVSCVPCRWLARYVTTARCSTSSFTVPSNSGAGSGTAFFLAPAAEKCGASIMAARASLLADGEQAVHRTGDGPAHKQQIALGVDLHDAEPQLGEVAGAHVPRHPLSLDDARGIGARCDRPGLAVARIAVRLRPAVEVIAVHHALE